MLLTVLESTAKIGGLKVLATVFSGPKKSLPFLCSHMELAVSQHMCGITVDCNSCSFQTALNMCPAYGPLKAVYDSDFFCTALMPFAGAQMAANPGPAAEQWRLHPFHPPTTDFVLAALCCQAEPERSGHALAWRQYHVRVLHNNATGKYA